MGYLSHYRVIFVTPDEKYYSKPIKTPCENSKDAEYHSRYIKPNNPGDKYVTVECEEEEFL